MHRQPRGQLPTRRSQILVESLQMGPRPLRIDVIDGHRTDATQIVRSGRNQSQHRVWLTQIGGNLQPHGRTQQQPGHRYCCDVSIRCQIGSITGGGIGLGAKVLQQHFLNVAVVAVAAPNLENRVH